MHDFKFGLGDLVECEITRIRGRIIALVKDIYSCNRYSIQPPYDVIQNKMPNGVTIDEQTLVMVEKSDKFPYVYVDGEFELGSSVRDTLFDKIGKIKDRRLNLNGCYSLTLTFLSKDGETFTFCAQEKGVELVKSRADSKVKEASRTTGSEMVQENYFKD